MINEENDLIFVPLNVKEPFSSRESNWLPVVNMSTPNNIGGLMSGLNREYPSVTQSDELYSYNTDTKCRPSPNNNVTSQGMSGQGMNAQGMNAQGMNAQGNMINPNMSNQNTTGQMNGQVNSNMGVNNNATPANNQNMTGQSSMLNPNANNQSNMGVNSTSNTAAMNNQNMAGQTNTNQTPSNVNNPYGNTLHWTFGSNPSNRPPNQVPAPNQVTPVTMPNMRFIDEEYFDEPLHMKILRDIDLADEHQDMSREISEREVETVMRRIQGNYGFIPGTLGAYNIPNPMLNLLIRRVIRITLQYCRAEYCKDFCKKKGRDE